MYRKTPLSEFHFNKVTSLKISNFIENRLQHRFFPHSEEHQQTAAFSITRAGGGRKLFDFRYFLKALKPHEIPNCVKSVRIRPSNIHNGTFDKNSWQY